MRALNVLSCAVAIIISSGEIARFWGSGRLVPLALDEIAIAAALIWAAWRSRRDGAGWHIAAWGAFSGLTLVLLIQTADHLINGSFKANAPVYLAALTGMLIVGLWCCVTAIRLVQRDRRR